MRVLHLAAADRWTGAAATALALVEALRGAGVAAELAYRPGNNLERRLAGLPWAHAVLAKERSLGEARAALARVRALAAGFDALHVHLPHDHALVRLAGLAGHTGLAGRLPVVRSIRHARHLRPDPFHRWLLRGTAAVALANSAMRPALARIPALRRVAAAVLPPAVEARFRPGDRLAARAALGLPPDAFVAGTVGKLDRSRGQDLLLHALAAVPGAWGLVVGAGAAERDLRRLAGRLGIASRISLPGYVEAGLERLYAAMDVFVFPAAGSDHGHRAIAEASACALPTLAADLPGVTDLVGPDETGAVYPAEDAAALAVLLREWRDGAALRDRAGRAALARAAAWTPARLAAAALDLDRRAGVRGA